MIDEQIEGIYEAMAILEQRLKDLEKYVKSKLDNLENRVSNLENIIKEYFTG